MAYTSQLHPTPRFGGAYFMLKSDKTNETILDGQVINRAIIYARVSTDEQAESGTSLDNQIEKSTAYVKSRGLQVVGVFREDYSGKTLDRPELNKVRKLIREGGVDSLIVYKPNRLDRSEWGINLLLILQELKELGVALHYSRDGREIDLHNPFEALMQSIAGWQAGEDHRETIEKLTEGRFQRARDGHVVPNGSQAPYGYKKVYLDGHWQFVIDEREAQVVRLMFRWYAVGDESGKPLTFMGIAKKLNDLGIPTRYQNRKGKGMTKVKSPQWWAAQISSMIKNETYIGRWFYGKYRSTTHQKNPRSEWVSVEIPPLVSQALWDLAQKRRERNVNTREHRKYNYLLVGLGICAECKKSIASHPVNRPSGKVALYYHCRSRGNPEIRHKCALPFLQVETVDPVIWQWVLDFVQDDETLKKGFEDYQNRLAQRVEPIEYELNLVAGELASKEQEWAEVRQDFKLARTPRLKASLMADLELIEGQISGLKQRQAKLQAEIAAQDVTRQNTTDLMEFIEQMRTDLDTISGDFESRKLFLQRLNIKVSFFVDETGRGGRITGALIPSEQVVHFDKVSTPILCDRLAEPTC